MKHTRYKFCPESLEYVEVKKTRDQKIKTIILYFGLSIIVSSFYFLAYLKIYDTPEEKTLKRENQELLYAFTDLQDNVTKINQDLLTIENRDEEIYRAVFDIPPLSSSIRNGGSGGVSRFDQYASLKNKEIVEQTAKEINRIENKIKIQSSSLDKLLKTALSKKEELLHIPAIQPVENRDLRRTGSGFGIRFHPILKIYRPHEGLDFVGPKGSEIYATADGVASSVRWSTTFGWVVEINHGYGYLTLYGHLSAFNVKQGQKVKRGDIIGFMGGTGLSSGSHLHYEVHKNGVPVDPIPYFYNDLSPEEFVRMKIIADSIKQSMD